MRQIKAADVSASYCQCKVVTLFIMIPTSCRQERRKSSMELGSWEAKTNKKLNRQLLLLHSFITFSIQLILNQTLCLTLLKSKRLKILVRVISWRTGRRVCWCWHNNRNTGIRGRSSSRIFLKMSCINRRKGIRWRLYQTRLQLKNLVPSLICRLTFVINIANTSPKAITTNQPINQKRKQIKSSTKTTQPKANSLIKLSLLSRFSRRNKKISSRRVRDR
jgi:hypothetical protein